MIENDSDVCIIGSGIAGVLAATTLQEKGYSVTVLEAGDWEDSFIDKTLYKINELYPDLKHLAFKIPGFDYPWVDQERDNFTNSGEVDYKLNKHRHKGVGGTVGRVSPIWHGWAIRPHAEDFAKQSNYDFGFDWPFDYEDLVPYFKKAEKELAVAGRNDNPYRDRGEYPLQKPYFGEIEQAFSPLLENLGLSFHTIPTATNNESDLYAYTTDSHIESGVSSGVNLISNAAVRRLQISGDGDRVESAHYTKNGETHSLGASHFIVAAGGVETARLLLLSQSNEYPNGLANTSGCVGKYFMEHPMIKVEAVINDQEKIQSGSVDGELISQEYYTPSMEFPNSIMLAFRKKSGGKIEILGQVEMAPQESNCITLNESVTDDYNDPVPDISLSYIDENRSALERTEEIILNLCEELGASVEYIWGPDNPMYANHHIGTTKMGSDPYTSVVNENLRTHDVENLSIISSSVFPTGFGANPTLTIAALSFKVCDNISI